MYQVPFKPSVSMSASSIDDLCTRIVKLPCKAHNGSICASCERNGLGVAFRHDKIKLEVTHPGGSIGRFLVHSHSLGQQHVKLLHGGYLHLGTECTITLPNVWGNQQEILGVVQCCVHLSGSVHNVSILHNKPINLHHFLKDADIPEALGVVHVNNANLKGSILLINKCSLEEKLLNNHLRESMVTIQGFRNSGAALDALHDNFFTLVIFDFESFANVTPEEIVKSIRATSFTGPIIGMSNADTNLSDNITTSTGINATLNRPFSQEQALAIIGDWLQSENSTGRLGPIHSDLDTVGNSDIIPIIDGYIKEVEQKMLRLRQHIAKGDIDSVRDICSSLRSSGSSFGFEIIATTSQDTLTALNSSMSLDESMSDLLILQDICDRLEITK